MLDKERAAVAERQQQERQEALAREQAILAREERERLLLLQREDRERARADQERAAAFDRAQQERRIAFEREQRDAARMEREQFAAQERAERDRIALLERKEHERAAALERESRMRQDLLELAEQRAHAAALETQLEVLRAAAATPPESKVADSSAPAQQTPAPVSQLVDVSVCASQPLSNVHTTAATGLDTLLGAVPACSSPVMIPQTTQAYTASPIAPTTPMVADAYASPDTPAYTHLQALPPLAYYTDSA